MATPVVVHTSPPHSLLSMNVNRGAKLLSLPSIHPGQLVKTDDRDGLCRDDVKLQYSKSPSNLHKLASAKRSTCLPLPSVDLHTTAVTELYKLLQSKLLRGHYHAIRHAFKIFSPQGNLIVTKCALYRLLRNFVPGLTPQNYSLLLKRINLDHQKIISFDEFFSKFHVSISLGNEYPRRCQPDPMSWQLVHSQLQDKARYNLPSFLTNFNSGQQITKSAFRRFLDGFSWHLQKGQFNSLWKIYDQEGNDWLTLPLLLKCLNVCTDNLQLLSNSENSTVTNISVDDAKLKLLQQFRELDILNCGKVIQVSSTQLCKVLSKAGIKFSEVQVQKVLKNLDFPSTKFIDYYKFVELFTSREKGSITHVTLMDSSSSSNGGVENSIINLLQGRFLKLLVSLKAHDAKNTGYVKKEDFKQCVRNLLACEDSHLENLTTFLCQDSAGHSLSEVPYPKFLSMLDSKQHQACTCLLSSCPLVQYPLRNKVLPKVQQAICSKLLEQVSTLVSWDKVKHFRDIDLQNTDRLTFDQTFKLLFKCGVNTTEDELLPLWDSFAKNRDGTVSFQQFFKELAKILPTGSKLRKRLTDDHFFMRSKTLHRDEDMLLDTLQYNVMYYHDSLLEHFTSFDPSHSGRVTFQNFKEVLKELCPAFTESELDFLALKHQDKKSCVNYINFLSSFSRGYQYKIAASNNMDHILLQKEKEITSTMLPLVSKPNCGLPGVKRCLQRQLCKKSKEVHRIFKTLDSAGSGNITVTNFKKVLEYCGTQLNREQMYHILEALDPNLSGLVNYQTFLEIIFRD